MTSAESKPVAHTASEDPRGGATAPSVNRAEIRRLAIFEDRYGAGSFERLLTWLQQPCVTFAEIAERLNVTRERVRQWHLLLMPGAPTGRERRRQCGLYQQKKRLLTDRVFGAFYRDVRQHLDGSRIEPIPSRAGYHTRVVRIDGRLVAIREVGRSSRSRSASSPAYRLPRYRGPAEFIYFKLGADGFLMMPTTALPVHGTTFAEDRVKRYQQFKNSFGALRTATRRSA